MSVKDLRKKIKQQVDDLSEERLVTLAGIVESLSRPPLLERIRKAEKDIHAGLGKNWREIRKDV